MKSILLAMLIAGWASVSALADANDSVRPVNVSAVNSSADEDDPYSTVSSTWAGHLYFTRGAEIFYSARNGKSWAAPKAFEDFQERGDYRSVFVAFPKKNLFPQHFYYATNADRGKANGRGDNFDIYLMIRERGNGGFLVPIPLHAISTSADEMHPCLAADGRLFFSRKTKDGWRVFVAKRPKPELNFEKPELVDLPPGFCHPALTNDGTRMFLQGPVKEERTGLFCSRLINGRWSPPESLAELNSDDGSAGDRSPSLSRDGLTLYFASDRKGGKGGLDIWSVPLSQLKKRP